MNARPTEEVPDSVDVALAHPTEDGQASVDASAVDNTAKLRRLVEIAGLRRISVDEAVHALVDHIDEDDIVEFLKGYNDREKSFKEDLKEIGIERFNAERLWRALQAFE